MILTTSLKQSMLFGLSTGLMVGGLVGAYSGFMDFSKSKLGVKEMAKVVPRSILSGFITIGGYFYCFILSIDFSLYTL